MNPIIIPKEALPRENGVFRVMSANVLAGRYSGAHWCRECLPMPERAELFAEVLRASLPDVAGVQEGDVAWTQNLPPYLDRLKEEAGADYGWLFTEINGRQNLTNLLYRRDLYEVEESGHRISPYWLSEEKYRQKDYIIRVYVWARFRAKNSPDRAFYLVNTHWGFSDECIVDAEAEGETVRGLLTAGIPVFCTGDYNQSPQAAAYQAFLQATPLRSAKETARAEGRLVNDTDGCGWCGRERTRATQQIDHIFYSAGVEVLRYATLTGNELIRLSDHSPQIADFQFCVENKSFKKENNQ